MFVNLSLQRGSLVTITHGALGLTVKDLALAPTPTSDLPHLKHYPLPKTWAPTIEGPMVSGAKTGDMFKLVHLRTPSLMLTFCGGYRSMLSREAAGMHHALMLSCYRPQRSCGQGNIFTPVCHSVHRGVSARENPPCQGEPPWDQTPRDQTPLPPGEQTAAYDQRATGTHPTGMHSC